MPSTPTPDDALLHLLTGLAARGYRFITPTPATHARVVARASRAVAKTVEDVFGWSLPFPADLIAPDLLADLHTAGMLDKSGPLLRSRVRVSTVAGHLHLHSAYPTSAEDAVFLGPDSYRFADAICDELARDPLEAAAAILDVGTGSGMGAILAGSLTPGATVTATDINPQALRLAGINARAAGVQIETVLVDGTTTLDRRFDLILINPPYLLDATARAYRHGGGAHGADLPLRLVRQALPQLAADGRLLLYTGSAIVDGKDALGTALSQLAEQAGCAVHYREIDPDIFGEELDKPAYADVDRIALVRSVIRKPPA